MKNYLVEVEVILNQMNSGVWIKWGNLDVGCHKIQEK